MQRPRPTGCVCMAVGTWVREAEPVGSLQEVQEVGLDREDLFGIYRNMLTARGIEERGHILYKQGKIPGSFYTGRGNEAVGRRRRDARWGPTTSAARSSATWACTSRAASSRGASSPSTWAAPTGRRTGATATSTSAMPGSGCTRWSATCRRCSPSRSGWRSRSGSARSGASRSPGAARAPRPAATRTRA